MVNQRRLVQLAVQVTPALKRFLVQAAETEGERLNVFVARALGEYFSRPELGRIPIGRGAGRRPKLPADA